MTNSTDRDENRKYSNDSAQQNNGYNFINTIKEDTTKIVNEIAKTQPTYIQAISNLQMRFIEATKNIINSTLGFQKQVYESFDNNSSTDFYKTTQQTIK